MKTKLIDWIPFINWLSSFGEKLSKPQRMLISRVNAITLFMCIFGFKYALITCVVFVVLGLLKPAIDLIKQVLN